MPTDIQRLHDFLLLNDPTMPRAMSPIYNDTQNALTQRMAQTKKSGGTITTNALANAIHTFLEPIIDPMWIRVAKAALSIAAQAGCTMLNNDAETMFANYAQCNRFLTMRTQIVLQLFEVFTDPTMKSFQLDDLDRDDVGIMLTEGAYASIVFVDSLCFNNDAFCDAWSQICQSVKAQRATTKHNDHEAIAQAVQKDLTKLKSTLYDQILMEFTNPTDDKLDNAEAIEAIAKLGDEEEEEANDKDDLDWSTPQHELNMV